MKVKEAPLGGKSPIIKSDVDVEAGLGTPGQPSSTDPPSGMVLPPSSKATSQPTSTEPNTTEPATTESPSTQPAYSATPTKSVAFKDIPPPKASAPPSRAPSKPGSALPSPGVGASQRQSRAEQAEEAMAARSGAPSQHSTTLVKSGPPSKTPGASGGSAVVTSSAGGGGPDKAGEPGDGGSDKSISPSQRFTPNRGLTHAEIF